MWYKRIFVLANSALFFLFCVVIMQPAPRRILAAQLGNFWRVDEFWQPDIDAAMREHPGDPDLAFAAAIRAGTPAQRVDALTRLCEQHPSDVVLCATLLRYKTTGDIYLIRDENVRPPSDVPLVSSLVPYDAAVANGECLDPQNAYFPMMRAVGSSQDGAIPGPSSPRFSPCYMG